MKLIVVVAVLILGALALLASNLGVQRSGVWTPLDPDAFTDVPRPGKRSFDQGDGARGGPTYQEVLEEVARVKKMQAAAAEQQNARRLATTRRGVSDHR